MKRIVSLLCAILFLTPLLCMLPFPVDIADTAAAASSRACPGSWTVSGVVNLNGDTCSVSQNIIVQSGGNLTIRNSDITLNLASDGQYHIEVQSGGALHILEGSNITTSNTDYETYMEAHSGSTLEIRDSELSEMGTLIPNYGIEIETSSAVIDNNTISAGFEGIFILNANPKVTNNTIRNMDYHGIEATNSNGVIADNVIKFSGQRGIIVDSGGQNMKIVNNNLTDNYEGLHVKIGTQAYIKGNTIDQNNNNGRGIIVDQSSPTIIGNVIRNVNAGIQYMSQSGGKAIGNDIQHGDGNQDVGIKVQQQSDPTLEGNTIYDFYRGVTVFGLSDPVLNGNTITGNSQYGIYLNGGRGTYTNNTINDTTLLDGVNMFSDSDTYFADNHIFDNANDGLHVEDSSIVLIGNQLYNNTISALHLIGTSVGDIRDNDFHDNGYGIEMEEDARATLRNNDFVDNIGRGIGIASTNHIDWFIDDDVLVRDNGINIAGNISIADTGSLTIEDLVFEMHSTASRKWWIDAEGPVTIDQATLQAKTETQHYAFRVHDTLTVTDSMIRDVGHTFSGNGMDAGLFINGTDAVIERSVVTSGFYGVIAHGSNVVMEDAQIDNNVMVGIRAAAGSTVVASNSTLSQNADKDLWLGGNSIIEMRNSTFNKAMVTYADPGSSLHVSWFLGINVSWPTGGMVEGAAVSVKDKEGTSVWDGTTNAQGDIGTKLVIKEYTKSQSTEVLYTPHNITASTSAIVVGYLDATVDASKNVNVVLGDLTAPTITITAPLDDAVFSTTVIAVSGTAADPESDIMLVEVSTNAGASWTVATGTTAWTASVALADGTSSITARATNFAGGKSTATVTNIYVDTNQPFITWKSPANNSLLNRRNVTVSGTTEANAMVTINGHVLNATNQGEFSLDLALVEGDNTITIRAEDRAQNWRESARYVTVDSIAPFIDVWGDAVRTTSNFQADINGSTEPGARVTINSAAVNTNPTTGEFSYPVILEEGKNVFRIEAEDKAKNKNSTSITIILDTTGPSLEIVSPKEGDILKERTVLAKGLTDIGGGIKAYINQAEVTVEIGGGFSSTITLNEGENTIYFKVVDSAGNEATDKVRVTVDSVVPTIKDLNYKTGQKVKVDKIMLEGDTEPKATVVVNGVTVTAGGTGHFSVEVPLKVGVNDIEITVTDIAGNSATQTIQIERETGGGGNGNGNGNGDDDVNSSLPMILAIVLILIIVIAAAAMLMKGGSGPTPPPGAARRREEPGPRRGDDRYPRRDEKDPYAEDKYDDYGDDGYGEGQDDGYGDDYGDDYAEGDYGAEGYGDEYGEGYEKEGEGLY